MSQSLKPWISSIQCIKLLGNLSDVKFMVLICEYIWKQSTYLAECIDAFASKHGEYTNTRTHKQTHTQMHKATQHKSTEGSVSPMVHRTDTLCDSETFLSHVSLHIPKEGSSNNPYTFKRWRHLYGHYLLLWFSNCFASCPFFHNISLKQPPIACVYAKLSSVRFNLQNVVLVCKRLDHNRSKLYTWVGRLDHNCQLS